MKENFAVQPASQDEIALYCYMGEALCMIQELEEALSHSITLKKYSTASREEADQALSKHRKRYTLGQAVQLSDKEKLYALSLQSDLNNFYQKRNWLVHKAMFECRDDLYTNSERDELFYRIKSIAVSAQKNQKAIELDMMNFCISKGRDMSKIFAVIDEGL